MKRGMRGTNGSGMVEGVLGMILLIGIMVVAALIVTNCGVAIFHKEKISYAAGQIAQYAAGLPWESDPAADTQAFADLFAKQMNLPDLDVTVEKLTIKRERAVRVSVTARGLKTVGNIPIIPKSITMAECAVAIKDSWKPDYILTVSLREDYGETMVNIPCYGRYFRDGRNGPNWPGTGYINFPHNGHIWMNWPGGGFTAQIKGHPDVHIFGKNAPSNDYGPFPPPPPPLETKGAGN